MSLKEYLMLGAHTSFFSKIRHFSTVAHILFSYYFNIICPEYVPAGSYSILPFPIFLVIDPVQNSAHFYSTRHT